MRTRHADQRGAATAELAMVLPLLVGVAAGLVWLLAVGTAQLRATDAARETARALARGDTESEAVAAGRQVAVPGSTVVVTRGAGTVRVVVRGHLDGPGGVFAHLPGADLEAVAVAADEAQVGAL